MKKVVDVILGNPNRLFKLKVCKYVDKSKASLARKAVCKLYFRVIMCNFFVTRKATADAERQEQT